MAIENRTKICTRCKQQYPATLDKRGQSRDYYLRNREAVTARAGEYRRRHLQKSRLYSRRYEQKIRQIKPEQIRTKHRRFKAAHPSANRIYDQRREARKRALPDSFTAEDWRRCLEYFNNCCAVCGRSQGLWHTISADHWTPLSASNCPGTVPSNIVPLCSGQNGCNNSKNKQKPETWLLRKFGELKAQEIINRINQYFQTLQN